MTVRLTVLDGSAPRLGGVPGQFGRGVWTRWEGSPAILGVVNLTIPNLTTPNLGGVPVEVEPEDIALTWARFSRYDSKICHALQGAPSCLVAAARKARDASN